jgi:hypothetical protein
MGLASRLGRLRNHGKTVWALVQVGPYLLRTYAPPSVFNSFYLKIFERRKIQRRYSDMNADFELTKRSLKLSSDWFSANLPFWFSIMDTYGFRNRPIEVLEIGSWEGLSSYFILSEMTEAHLTCVDTWEGSDENKDGSRSPIEVLNRIEENFDHNLLPFSTRLTKFKGTSFSFFEAKSGSRRYDLIYIDGSHHCDDVIVDAIKSFDLLKMGGVMIFDDYFWHHYPKATDNPASAINLFLRAKKGSFAVIMLDYQLGIVKTADSQRN